VEVKINYLFFKSPTTSCLFLKFFLEKGRKFIDTELLHPNLSYRGTPKRKENYIDTHLRSTVYSSSPPVGAASAQCSALPLNGRGKHQGRSLKPTPTSDEETSRF
jgi:hypothetical protein